MARPLDLSAHQPPSGPTLRLRRWVPDDVADLCAAWQDPELRARFGMAEPSTPESSRTFVAMCEERWEAGTACFLAIVDAGNSALLGGCDLSDLEPGAMGAQADVGYWVRAEARGRGVGAAALAMLLQWAEADLGLTRFSLEAEADNVASSALARGAGFVADGTARVSRSPAGERVLVRYERRGSSPRHP